MIKAIKILDGGARTIIENAQVSCNGNAVGREI
jgi:hypothetical protein